MARHCLELDVGELFALLICLGHKLDALEVLAQLDAFVALCDHLIPVSALHVKNRGQEVLILYPVERELFLTGLHYFGVHPFLLLDGYLFLHRVVVDLNGFGDGAYSFVLLAELEQGCCLLINFCGQLPRLGSIQVGRELDAALRHLESKLEVAICRIGQVKVLFEAHEFDLVLGLNSFLVIIDRHFLQQRDAVLKVFEGLVTLTNTEVASAKVLPCEKKDG